jgi:hypothetical protein
MQLNDPTGLSPVFSDAFSGLHGPQIPGDRAAVAAFALADLHRKLAAEAELILDLTMQLRLVSLYGQPLRGWLRLQDVGALLRCELKNAFVVCKTKTRIERPMVSGRKQLQIIGATAVAENSKDGHQQKKPLRVADPAALAALRQALKKTDQIGLIGSGNMRLGQWSEAMRPSQPQEKGRRQGEAG